jgi:hypothetical protein
MQIVMNMIKRAMVVLMMSVASGLAPSIFAAGAAGGVQVISVRVDSDGRGIIAFSSALGGTPPGCVIGAYTSSLAIDTNTAGGKSALATAVVAKASGYLVWVYGLGACSVYGNYVEDMGSIVAQ